MTTISYSTSTACIASIQKWKTTRLAKEIALHLSQDPCKTDSSERSTATGDHEVNALLCSMPYFQDSPQGSYHCKQDMIELVPAKLKRSLYPGEVFLKKKIGLPLFQIQLVHAIPSKVQYSTCCTIGFFRPSVVRYSILKI